MIHGRSVKLVVVSAGVTWVEVCRRRRRPVGACESCVILVLQKNRCRPRDRSMLGLSRRVVESWDGNRIETENALWFFSCCVLVVVVDQPLSGEKATKCGATATRNATRNASSLRGFGLRKAHPRPCAFWDHSCFGHTPPDHVLLVWSCFFLQRLGPARYAVV